MSCESEKYTYLFLSYNKDTAWSFFYFVDSGMKKHQRESDQKRPDKPQQLNSVKAVLYFFLCVGPFLWLGIFLILGGIKMKLGSWLGEVFIAVFRNFRFLNIYLHIINACRLFLWRLIIIDAFLSVPLF